MNKFLIIPINLLIIFSLVSCNRTEEKRKVKIGSIKIEKIKIKRYEQALFSINLSEIQTELKRLQPDYIMFLDGDLNDSSNLKKITDYLNDTLLIAVFHDCQKIYPELSAFETELTEAFRYYHYHYKERPIPDVYTYISGFDYAYPVAFADHHLLIAIDLYLGADYPRYKRLGLANYILRRFSSEYLVRDCMIAIAQNEINYRKTGPTLLDMMITEGKKMWFANAMLPNIRKQILLDYTDSQWQWAEKGEPVIWAFLIENEMLYKSDQHPLQKFLSDGPFTSYFGSESPPRLGAYIGWKIIASYMNRNKEITVEQLMDNYNSQEILRQSGYKPKF